MTVDTEAKTSVYNHEYYLMKHLSHFVRPGARYLETVSYTGHENQLAFANPHGSIVLVVQNDLCQEMPVRLVIGNRMIAATLPADSFNTFVLLEASPALYPDNSARTQTTYPRFVAQASTYLCYVCPRNPDEGSYLFIPYKGREDLTSTLTRFYERIS